MFPGVVPHSGHNPTSTDENWSRFFTIGPMSRYAEDLAPMLKVLANENTDKLRLDEKVKNSFICAYGYQRSHNNSYHMCYFYFGKWSGILLLCPLYF
jgi:Asp-tRNA(Asn)/Glu-tRNA(Gln) amidotransferase A subunit family amidase